MTDGRTDRQTDGQTDICDSRVAFATENVYFSLLYVDPHYFLHSLHLPSHYLDFDIYFFYFTYFKYIFFVKTLQFSLVLDIKYVI